MNPSNLPIIPHPQSVTINQGTFHLSDSAAIEIQNNVLSAKMVPRLEQEGQSGAEINNPDGCREIASIIDDWLEDLRKTAGLSLPLVSSKGEIKLILSPEIENTEGYELSISPEGVKLKASRGPGFFLGLQSLTQLLSASPDFPCCQIIDEPRFKWRGLHLDAGRFFQPLGDVKKHLDLMARHKYNVLHWHLTEDQGWRIEIKKYPRLTEVGSRRKETLWGHMATRKKIFDGRPHGGFYSQDDIREIVQYGRDRNIMIVPEIDMPGHGQAAIAAYPELGVTGKKLEVFKMWGVCPNIFNPEETTIQFFRDVMNEVTDLFPSPWIHIGGDEAVKPQWRRSKRVRQLLKERGLKNNHQMQSWFIKKITSHLLENNRKAIGWDEIMEGGAPEGANIMAWRHEKHGIAAVNQGLPVIMTPTKWTYLDYHESKAPQEPLTISSGYMGSQPLPLSLVYSWEPIPPKMDSSQAGLVMGGQGQLWTEYMPDFNMLSYMAWPRGMALSEVLWSPKGEKDFDDFFRRLNITLKEFDRSGQIFRFQGKELEGQSLLVTPVEEEYTIACENIAGLPPTFTRIQLLFYRKKKKKGAMEISEAALHTADGVRYKLIQPGFAGPFNRLNFYTLGKGSPIAKEGSFIRFKARGCTENPFDKKKKATAGELSWSLRFR